MLGEVLNYANFAKGEMGRGQPRDVDRTSGSEPKSQRGRRDCLLLEGTVQMIVKQLFVGQSAG